VALDQMSLTAALTYLTVMFLAAEWITKAIGETFQLSMRWLKDESACHYWWNRAH
jgi:hypothetical protein